jgi:hypothetical protein
MPKDMEENDDEDEEDSSPKSAGKRNIQLCIKILRN